MPGWAAVESLGNSYRAGAVLTAIGRWDEIHGKAGAEGHPINLNGAIFVPAHPLK